MRRLTAGLAAAALAALAVTGSAVVAGAVTNAAPNCRPGSGKQIGAVDQRNGERVLILRQDVDWRCSNAVAWQLTLGWSHLTDVKFRVYHGQREVLVSSGGGRIGIYAYPSKARIWTAQVPGPANPHSIELLPNGAVVVADSLGRAPGSNRDGRLLFYPRNSTRARQLPLQDAHGVLYNDGRLWAVGGSRLQQYDISATGIRQHGSALDGRRFSGAHDLSPMTGDSKHRMWIAANKVFFYDKYSGKPPVAWSVPASRSCVKAFGTQPDGQIVEAWRSGCTGSIYLSDTVYLYRYDGTHPVRKTLSGAGFYKARPVTWSYY